MLDIKIYQINMDRDEDNIKFRDLEFIKGRLGIEQINSGAYDKVYAGQVDAKTLEDVYSLFNLRHPESFCGHSLSVSDVVEVAAAPKIVGVIECDATGSKSVYTDFLEYVQKIEELREMDVGFAAHDYTGLDVPAVEKGFYFCDSIGFKRIDFDPAKTLSVFPEKESREHNTASTPVPKNISLWARLGVSIEMTPEDLEILKAGGPAAKDKLLELVRSDKCVLDGETYFPGMANERYFVEDIEFNIGPYSLHDTKEPAVTLSETIKGPVEIPTLPDTEAKVFICSGSVKREIYDGTYEECLDFCDRNKWVYKDENEFVWNLDLDDLREQHLEVSTPSLDDKIRNADSRVVPTKNAAGKEPERNN